MRKAGPVGNPRKWVEGVAGSVLLISGLAGTPALAQASAEPAGASAAQTVSFDIPAQDLNAALLAFAARADLQLVYDVSLVDGLRSAPVSGNYTPRDALGRLLSGTGLRFSFTGLDTVSLSSGENGKNLTAPILVEEAAAEYARGPVGGYIATRSATGSKTGAAIIETPQAVNVVTRDQIEDQGAQTAVEALQYTPGVVAQYGNNDVRHDWFTVRGFTPARYLDGLRLPFGARGYAQPRIEPYGLERMEVLKGPASVLYGQGTPGGMLNMVKKRPQADFKQEIELQTGSHERKQAAFDLGGAVDEEGDFLVRLVGLFRDTDTEFDYVEEEKAYIAPSFTWTPDADTSFTFFGEYQRIHSPGGGGAPALLANGTLYTDVYPELPRDAFVGEPGYDEFTNKQWFAGYELTHDFNEIFSFRQNLRYGEVDVDTQRVQAYCNGSTIPCNPSGFYRYAWAFPETSDLFTVDNQITADFATGALSHTVLLGLDYSKETSAYEESSLQVIYTPFNAYDPVYGATPINRPPAAMRIDQDMAQTGVYLEDRVHVGGFTLSLAGRHDWVDTDTDSWTASSGTTTGVNQSDSAFTGRAGIVYLFDNGLAPYASYSTSFDPATGSDRNGVPFDPTKGEQYEVGVKYQPTSWTSFITLSTYQLTQKDVLTPDPVNTSFQEQTGEVRIRGVELEGKAQFTDGLAFIASYAYTDSEITKDNPGGSGASNEGNRFAFVPRHQATAWIDYEVQQGPMAGLGVGAGLRYMGQTYGDNANVYDIPDYTLFDASLRYDLGRLAREMEGVGFSVSARNVFDRKYVSTCIAPSGCYWGTGRSVYATLSYNW